PGHFVFPANGKRYFRSAFGISRRRIVRHRGFDETLRRRPDGKHSLHLSIGRGRRRGSCTSRRVCRRHGNVPCVIAADNLNLALFAEERRAASSWHHGSHLTQQFCAHAAGVVIDGGRIVLHINLRPWFIRQIILSNRKVCSGTCELKCLDSGYTERVGSCLKRVALLCCERGCEHQRCKC